MPAEGARAKSRTCRAPRRCGHHSSIERAGMSDADVTALAAIGALADDEIEIADAALQLARIDAPDGDLLSARAHLSALARGAVEAAADIAEGDLVGQVGALAALLGGRHGYCGDT